MLAWLLAGVAGAQEPLVTGTGLLPGGSVELQVAPDHLVLGKDARATVSVVVRGPDGVPVDPSDLTLVSNVGHVEKLEKDGAGQFHAAFRAPKAAFPHVAMFLARASHQGQPLAGVAFLPLWGQGQLTIQTKPDAVVTVRVGEAVFGPSAANEKGTANITVQAPPGPTLGVADVVDPAGNQTKQTVDLGVPSFNRLAAFPQRSVRAGEKASILLLAVDRRGTPLAEASLAVKLDRGGPFELTQLRAGVWRLDARAPDEVGNGRMRVTVALGAQKDSTADVLVAVKPGPPAKALITLRPPQKRAGKQDRISVTARVLDATGNATPVTGLTAQVTPGEITDVTVEAGGVLRGRWVPPDDFGGLREGTLTVRDAQGQVLGTATLPLRAASAESLRVSKAQPANDKTLPAGTLQVDVAATDKFGNARPDAGFSFTSPDGATLLVRRPNADGSTRLLFLPPASASLEKARVVIRTDQGATEDFSVAARPLHKPWLLFGPRVAGQWNLGRLLLGGGGLDAVFSVPLPLPDLPFRLGITGGASAGLTSAAPVSFSLTQPLRLDRTLFTVPSSLHGGAELAWERLVVQASLGVGVVFAQARIRQPGQPWFAFFGGLPPVLGLPQWGEAARLSSVAPSVMGRTLVGVRLGPGVLFGDVRMDVPLLLGSSLNGFTGGLTVGGGYALLVY